MAATSSGTQTTRPAACIPLLGRRQNTGSRRRTGAKHYRDLAFMGFAEVLLNLRTILRSLKFCKEDMAAWQPRCADPD